MSTPAPQLGLLLDALGDPGRFQRISNADDVIERLLSELAKVGWTGGESESQPWVSREGGAGTALVYLFARLAELTFNRLDQVPDKVMRDFLIEAGIDLLAPEPARLDVSLNPAPDLETLIRAPAGTQLATLKSEDRAEIVFETENDLVVAPNQLTACVGLDRLRSADYLGALQGAETFSAFAGETERERILYLADPAVLVFDEEPIRAGATVTLNFKLLRPGDPEADGGWRLSWLYWDAETEKWRGWHSGAGSLIDGTDGLRHSGLVQLGALPELGETQVDGESQTWIACSLSGGTDRAHLPVIDRLSIGREVTLTGGAPQWQDADAAWTALTAAGAYLPLDPAGEFYPLGQHPRHLDGFYVQADEAFSKAGATVEFKMDLTGIGDGPDNTEELTDLELQWEYYGADGWMLLGTSQWQTSAQGQCYSAAQGTAFADATCALTATGTDLIVSFTAPSDFTKTAVNELEGYWLRVRVVQGSYDQPGGMFTDSAGVETWEPPQTYPPVIQRLQVRYSGYDTDALAVPARPPARVLTLSDGMAASHTAAVARGDAIGPFDGAEEGPGLFLGLQRAFPADEWIQLLLDVETLESDQDFTPAAGWEYWNGAWRALRVSDGSQGLSERGYLGFFAPRDHSAHTLFGTSAYWLRISPYAPPTADAGASRTVVSRRQPEGGAMGRVTLDASDSQALTGLNIRAYHWRISSTSAWPSAEPRMVVDGTPVAGRALVTTTSGQATRLELDARASSPGQGGPVVRYHWSRPVRRDTPLPIAVAAPVLTAGQPINQDHGMLVAGTTGDKLRLRLDADGALPISGGAHHALEQYHWRSLQPEPVSPPIPVIKTIRLNTVAAVNAETVRGEILGSSDDSAGQRFSLTRPPVLPGARILVREPDRPPEEDLDTLERELRDDDPNGEALPSVTGNGEGVWVRWHRVTRFNRSGPSSRHFMLDPIDGQIAFGDGRNGKIPPLGQDNIQALHYRTHAGAAGNVDAAEVSVLRNPSGDLADVKTVSNAEAAAGGAEEETLARLHERGPQSLKHRDRTVTWEDFQWLALEASGEIATARCLPTTNGQGLTEPGWVTVVITPDSDEPKPAPSAGLIRLARNYLEEHALTSLAAGGGAASRIHVQGPEYIEVTVQIQIVPEEPEQADAVEQRVLDRLAGFLHPLGGGPQRQGWTLGRDVFVSELYHEVESVPGVDHASHARLLTSHQQYYLQLAQPANAPFVVPAGSQVGSFDERLRLRLARSVHPLSRGNGGNSSHLIGVYGFKAGDRVDLVASDNSVLVAALDIAAIDGERLSFQQAFAKPVTWNARDALMSQDERIRLPLRSTLSSLDAQGKVTALGVVLPAAGDSVCIGRGSQRDPGLEFLIVERVTTTSDRVFVPEGHLVYSGNHDVQMALG